MLQPSWQDRLARALTPQSPRDGPPRVAVLGIGNAMHGDDAAGVLAARELSLRFGRPDESAVPLIVDAGLAPENHTGTLRRFAPDFVLLVDAAQMNELPGAIGYFDWQAATGLSASTHTLPLSVLAGYLVGTLGCRVGVLGIQPANDGLDAPLSPEVRAGIEEVVRQLANALRRAQSSGGVRTPVKIGGDG